LSFGLSIAVVPLIGLGLNYTPWGIRLTSILVSLLAFILIMSSVAWIRRRQLPPAERFGLDFHVKMDSLAHFWQGQKRIDKILAVILVVAIFSAVGTLGYVVATPQIGEKYSEFYILGLNGKAEGYPTVLSLGQEGAVIVGVVNHEQAAQVYRIEIDISGTKVQEMSPFTLTDGAKWEQTMTFKPVTSGLSQKVDFLLFKDTAADAYDSLHLWIDVR